MSSGGQFVVSPDSLPRLRRPDAALRHAAAVSATPPANVVRQLMTHPWSRPIRSVPQGNANNGGDPLLPRTAFVVAASLAVLENSVTRPINRAPTHPSTATCQQLPRLGEPVEPTRSGPDRRTT